MKCKVFIYVGEIVGCWCCGSVSVAFFTLMLILDFGLIWEGKLTNAISISRHTSREIGICSMHSLHNRYICILGLRGSF